MALVLGDTPRLLLRYELDDKPLPLVAEQVEEDVTEALPDEGRRCRGCRTAEFATCPRPGRAFKEPSKRWRIRRFIVPVVGVTVYRGF